MLTEQEEKMERFWVSQWALIIRDDKCLILEDATAKGVWVLPGGRADKDETDQEAFTRELREEIGVEKFKRLAVVDYGMWYSEHRHLPVCAVLSLIDIGDAEIRISPEHTQMKWVSVDEVEKYEFRWPMVVEWIRNGFAMSGSGG